MRKYNLVAMVESIRGASQYQSLDDENLARALEYFEQAQLIYQSRSKLASPMSRQFKLLISSVFLNLWKAASVIVGDPTKDKDYQRRYRELGFDYDFFVDKMEKLRNLRNHYDVAHYSLCSDDIEVIERAQGEAVKIVTDVIKHYRDHLIRTGE